MTHFETIYSAFQVLCVWVFLLGMVFTPLLTGYTARRLAGVDRPLTLRRRRGSMRA